ncbi:hypothetical protein ACFX2J_041068 [Malus domestica]
MASLYPLSHPSSGRNDDVSADRQGSRLRQYPLPRRRRGEGLPIEGKFVKFTVIGGTWRITPCLSSPSSGRARRPKSWRTPPSSSRTSSQVKI